LASCEVAFFGEKDSSKPQKNQDQIGKVKEGNEVRAFKGPIVRLECSTGGPHVAVSSHSESVIRVYATVDMQLEFVLRGGHGPNSFIAGICFDESSNVPLFSFFISNHQKNPKNSQKYFIFSIFHFTIFFISNFNSAIF
jgi:hypothetical protein